MAEKSPYLGQYLQFMSGITQSTMDNPSPQQQKLYRLIILPKVDHTCNHGFASVRLCYVGHQATVASYVVDLGRFRFTITVLNLSFKAPTGELLGAGAFGKIQPKTITGQQFVAKVIRNSKTTLTEVVVEVAISKLCALFSIGPAVELRIPFDVITYVDAFQIHLERCRSIAQMVDDDSLVLSYLEFDLKRCLNRLHLLHIAHRDVKVENVLWCERLKRYVLCDFGVADYVKEELGSTSQTDCAGTPSFMCSEMYRLYQDRNCGMRVDLYYNDVHAWEKSLEAFKELNFRANYEQPDILIASSSYRHLDICSLLSVDQDNIRTLTQLSSQAIDAAFDRPDSYEFYTVVWAAVSRDEHRFRLAECIHKLSVAQLDFVHQLLTKCLNIRKMEALIDELTALPDIPGSLRNDWLTNFQQAYNENFIYLEPRLSQATIVTRRWLSNLLRLIRTAPEHLALKEMLEGDPATNKAAYKMMQGIVDVTRYKPLHNICWDKKVRLDFCKKYSITPQQITLLLRLIILGGFPYDVRLTLLKDIFHQQPQHDDFLRCITRIARKQIQAAELLEYFTDEQLERCILLVNFHYAISNDHSDAMLEICVKLLQRIPQQQSILLLNISHFQLFVRFGRLQLLPKDLRRHFEETLPLLQDCTHDDSPFVGLFLHNMFNLLVDFNFPLEEITTVFLQFEQHRLFYIEMDQNTADDTICRMNMRVPTNPSCKEQQVQWYSIRNQYRRALQCLRQIPRYSLMQDNIMCESWLLLELSRNEQAGELLEKIAGQVQTCNSLMANFRHKNLVRCWLMTQGRLAEAESYCLKLLALSKKMAEGSHRLLIRNHIKLQLAKLNLQQVVGLSFMDRYAECSRYFCEIQRLEKDKNNDSYEVEVIHAHHAMLALCGRQRKIEEELLHSWEVLRKTRILGDDYSCSAYSSILRHAANLGEEGFSLISYARQFTDAPARFPRGTLIADVLYQNKIPTGVLPMDMPIKEFVDVAERRLRTMPAKQHAPCYLFKRQLLTVMPTKFADEPQYLLMYVRTMVEVVLHRFVSEDYIGTSRILPEVIRRMEAVNVQASDRLDKQLLLEFASGLLARSHEFTKDTGKLRSKYASNAVKLRRAEILRRQYLKNRQVDITRPKEPKLNLTSS